MDAPFDLSMTPLSLVMSPAHFLPDEGCAGTLVGRAWRLVVQGPSVDATGEPIFQAMLRVASGERTCRDLHGSGGNAFVRWQLGVTT